MAKNLESDPHKRASKASIEKAGSQFAVEVRDMTTSDVLKHGHQRRADDPEQANPFTPAVLELASEMQGPSAQS